MPASARTGLLPNALTPMMTSSSANDLIERSCR